MATQKPKKRKPRVAPDPALVAAVGTPIRFEKAHSKRGAPKASEVAVVVAQEINPVRGFGDFLREYAVVGLAVGFIVGLQAQAVVKSLVDTFINPAFNLLFGEPLVKRSFTLEFHDRVVAFPWGVFAYALLNFMFIMLVIFLLVKFLHLDKYQKAEKAEIDKIREKK